MFQVSKVGIESVIANVVSTDIYIKLPLIETNEYMKAKLLKKVNFLSL